MHIAAAGQFLLSLWPVDVPKEITLGLRDLRSNTTLSNVYGFMARTWTFSPKHDVNRVILPIFQFADDNLIRFISVERRDAVVHCIIIASDVECEWWILEIVLAPFSSKAIAAWYEIVCWNITCQCMFEKTMILLSIVNHIESKDAQLTDDQLARQSQMCAQQMCGFVKGYFLLDYFQRNIWCKLKAFFLFISQYD